jgi:transcriptional regulator with AAA-type ATPase domain
VALFTPLDRRFVATLAQLSVCNPFVRVRIEFERTALGEAFDDRLPDWNLSPEFEREHGNVQRLFQRAEHLLSGAREHLQRGAKCDDNEWRLYENLVLFVLYHRHRLDFAAVIQSEREPATAGKPVKLYRAFLETATQHLGIAGRQSRALDQLPHIFAGFFQIRRAFENIFQYIIGVSRPAARLRAAVWQSIFTHDIERYRRALFDRMGDYTTLITGASGTGKELVARAIALSRYIPFDAASQRFAESFAGSFYAINLSALSPTLIESELFGHSRGAFTGAVADRAGWLEQCPKLGTVFLDEIGDLDATIQVKLLRLLQTRTFNRLGDTRPREFHGKIIAATNRDLAAEMREGRFREDFYYRLCSDLIETPTLRERTADDPHELRQLILYITERLVGPEAADVTREVEAWIETHLGSGYEWPGNVRELEQCVRNLLIRKHYGPPKKRPPAPTDAHEELMAKMRQAALTADDLVREYCRLVYAQTGSYEATARKLNLDRRTVKAKVHAPAG